MESLMYLLDHLVLIWPALLIGCFVPVVTLIVLRVSRVHKNIPFNTVFHGIGTFFAVLFAVAVLTFTVSQLFFASVPVSAESDVNPYIYIGGLLILAAFYVSSEFLKLYTFDLCLKSEDKNRFAGLTFGSGFILAQNVLVIGLINMGEFDYSQSAAFGLMVLLSGALYLLNAEIGYQLALSGQRFSGLALSGGYYVLFAAMLIVSNIYVTYILLGILYVLYLMIGYKVLPHPFKKKD